MRVSSYREMNMDALEMEQKHIFHKMIFDSLNETLDYKRVYGLSGRPMAFSIDKKTIEVISKKETWALLE